MICDAGFEELVSDTIYPISALASLLSIVVISLCYMVGSALNNPKLLTYAKTEIVQVFVSIASVMILLQFVQSFCDFTIESIAEMFDVSVSSPSLSMYGGAMDYLEQTAEYSSKVLSFVRYHLKGIDMLNGISYWECPLICLFGTAGEVNAPFAGLVFPSILFNTVMFSYLFSLHSLFILLYSYTGLPLFLLPLGIFIRQMPFLRTFGGLLIAVSFSFLIIYPFFLALFDVVFADFIETPSLDYEDPGALDYDLYIPGRNEDYYLDEYFPQGIQFNEAFFYTSKSFIISVFFPILALLASFAALRYTTKFLGEEIDLSRLVQMV